MNKLVIFALLFASVAAFPRPQRKIPGGGRIVGGRPATPGQFPYQIMHRWNTQYICGAFMIDPWFVITAAHCVQEGGVTDPPASITLIAGKHLRVPTGANEQSRRITSVVAHAGYDEYWFYNDIAIMKVETPFEINEFVRPVLLPERNFNVHPASTTVSGWGTTSSGGPLANELLFVSVPTVADADCQGMYPQEDIVPSMLCAGEVGGGVDSCQGDSGGPLVANVTAGEPTVVGVVSWGYDCAQPGYPGVYTEVSYFIDWINEQRQLMMAEAA